jgi:hypothetical protein
MDTELHVTYIHSYEGFVPANVSFNGWSIELDPTVTIFPLESSPTTIVLRKDNTSPRLVEVFHKLDRTKPIGVTFQSPLGKFNVLTVMGC